MAEVPSEPPGPELPAACRGAALDLDRLLELEDCDTSDPAGPPPEEASIEATLEPVRPTLRPNESIELTLRITNKTTAPLTLDLNVTERCSPFRITAYDAKGKIADHEGGCLQLELCGKRVLRVRLDQGGFLTKKLPFKAEVSRESDNCEELPSRPMRSGMYRLVTGLPFREPHGEPFSDQEFRKTSTILIVR